MKDKKCIECGEPVDMKGGDVPIPGMGKLMCKDEEVDTCRKCFAKGVITNPAEIIDALNKDPLFQVGYQSPIQQKDLLDL